MKFRNRREVYQGISFSSGLERAVYQHLDLLSKGGEIKVEQIQDSVKMTLARIDYRPDFRCSYVKTGEEFWVEAKGISTAVWMIKKRLWKHYGPGPLHVYKGTKHKVYLDEVITPETK